MSSTRVTGINRPGGFDPVEVGEIHTLPESLVTPTPRALLKPGEEAVSLPPSNELPNAVAPLTNMLGAKLTVDSPAWSGDPVPGMRGLQKTLVGFSLQLEEHERGDLMTAIGLVEKAVQMRLRWQQMRRSEMELLVQPQNETVEGEGTK
ncbi:MAG TPA: hypothetical protein VM571_14985 [Noviherbaspirillum sp.]|nr:hypothetical protein [Noviherbaspirillum sp.]